MSQPFPQKRLSARIRNCQPGTTTYVVVCQHQVINHQELEEEEEEEEGWTGKSGDSQVARRTQPPRSGIKCPQGRPPCTQLGTPHPILAARKPVRRGFELLKKERGKKKG